MKRTILIAAAMIFSSGIAWAADTATGEDHKVEHAHAHQHGKNCGHKVEKHGDHTDYEEVVDGKVHHHKQHGEHYDECNGPESDAKRASNG